MSPRVPPLEPLFGGVFEGRRVLVTGHTGFKGSWLTSWLLDLDAQVAGYALEPPTEPSLFDALRIAERIDHVIGDVRDPHRLREEIGRLQPEVVFHLAAQALVRSSYEEPAVTYATNVMGTVNLLEAVRATPSVRAVVNVTSDKCYENREWEYAYRENDPLGGYDPYSSSKACAELVTTAYRRSFFGEGSQARVATARAGNVIGGGDWAADRIVPDCIRALVRDEPIVVRNPDAVRPWQHVLEPTSAYLWLAARMWEGDPRAEGAWNFGPASRANVPVREVVEAIIAEWGSGSWRTPDPGGPPQPHEARFLKLDCSRAADLLGWRPVYGVQRALSAATAWYRAHHSDPTSAAALTADDIGTYVAEARRHGAVWTR